MEILVYLGYYGITFDEPLKVGDKIILEDMIHYTMVKLQFNGIKLPSIVIKKMKIIIK